jgi:hypothetical protein
MTVGDTIRVRVRGGRLEPIEQVSLPEGKVVTVTILDVPSERDPVAFRRACGGWRGTLDAEALLRNIYADRLVATRPQPRL